MSDQDVTSELILVVKTFSTTINLNPSGGTLVVSGTGGGTFNNVTSPLVLALSYGTHTWEYSLSGYVTQSGSWSITEASTKNIILEVYIPQFFVKI